MVTGAIVVIYIPASDLAFFVILLPLWTQAQQWCLTLVGIAPSILRQQERSSYVWYLQIASSIVLLLKIVRQRLSIPFVLVREPIDASFTQENNRSISGSTKGGANNVNTY